MPNPSELARLDEENAEMTVEGEKTMTTLERNRELDNQLPPQFKRFMKAAYPLSKKAMDEKLRR